METFSALLALCAGNSPVPVNSPHKGQWRGALMSSFICIWINDWVNNREASDLRRQRGHYDVNVMVALFVSWSRPWWVVKHASVLSGGILFNTYSLFILAPSHYLSLYWLIVNWTTRNIMQCNIITTPNFSFKNYFACVVCKWTPFRSSFVVFVVGDLCFGCVRLRNDDRTRSGSSSSSSSKRYRKDIFAGVWV